MNTHCRNLLSLFSLCLALGPLTALAQSKNTEHTFKLDENTERLEATLADVAWLVGSWEGEAFGSQFEEVWNPESAGSMVGLFKLMKDDQVNFYELMVIVEEEGSLSLKVKHFSNDFIAWEEKEDYVTFKLVKLEENAIHFSGLSFYRNGDNEMTGYIVMLSKEKKSEEKLNYRRH
jgi:hypothetical protein